MPDAGARTGGAAARRRRAAMVLAVALSGAWAAACAAAAAPERHTGRVAAVLDGDTIVVVLPGGGERVRLIGIDAPELHESAKLERDVARTGRARAEIQALGAHARRALAAAVQDRTVRLERDVETRDRYGRTLAWVWRDDGTLVNEALVREGWARLYTVPPNVRHVQRLRDAQRDARAARRGIWAASLPADPGSTPAPGERPGAGSGSDVPDRAGPGVAPAGRDCPPAHPVKGNRSSRPGAECIYHVPGCAHYALTRPERCYASRAEAAAAGCRRARPR